MKVAIVGSRNLSIKYINHYFPQGMQIDEIISGGAKGIDACAKHYAHDNRIPYTEVLPEYKRYGRAAPIIRNRKIVDMADHVIIFWDGESRGTNSVLDYCYKSDTPCSVFQFKIIGGDPCCINDL